MTTPLTFDEYQALARTTAVYPRMAVLKPDVASDFNLAYPALGLTGEAGEVADKVKKLIRDANGTVSDEARDSLAKELGDVLWYVSALASELGLQLSDVAQANYDKLRARQQAGKLGGSGDNR